MGLNLVYKRLNFLFNYFFHGLKSGFKDNPYFNKNSYLNKYPDVKESGMGAVKHYLVHGINENRNDIYDINIKSFKLVQESGLFDYVFYSHENNLNFNSYDQALFHYLEYGYKEGLNPSKYFDSNFYTNKYLKNNNDINPLVHYLRYGQYDGAIYNKNRNLSSLGLIKHSGLFDFDYYSKISNFNFKTLNDAINHYLESGYELDLNPSEKFDGVVYLKKYPDVKSHNFNPLVHYLKFGKSEGRSDLCDKNVKEFNLVKNSNLFNLNYYNSKNNLHFGSERRALFHYLSLGYKKGFNPSDKFNGNVYVKKYPEILTEGWNPLVHYLKFGKNEGKNDLCDKNIKEFNLVKNSGYFNYNYYKNESKLTFDSERLALLHYLEVGYKQNFNPSEKFAGDSYFNFNPDVKKHGWNPLVHYLKFGKKEGRFFTKVSIDEFNLIKYSCLFDLDYYEIESGLNFKSERDGIIHYLETGFKEGFNPCAKFDGNDYYERYNDVSRNGINPLIHYLKYGKNENREGIKKFIHDNFNESFNVKQILANLSKEVTIIMPIHNLFNSKRFVKNLYNTTKNFELILIDTLNSSDKDLKYFCSFKNLKIIRGINSNSDFIDSVNEIIENSCNDIIFIKENVITFRDSISKLIIAAYSNDTIGFVTPISNFSTIELVNLPKNNHSQKIINYISGKKYLESPLSNDSCVYIKNEVFKGLKFDNSSDDKSWIYDFYELAKIKGWKSIIDDSTFVYWDNGQVINTQKDKYDLSTPYYTQNNPNKDFIKSGVFSKIYDNIHQYSKDDFNRFNKKTVLFSMHYGGGVEYTVKDIIKSISDEFECYLLKAFKNALFLYKYCDGELTIVEEFNLHYDWNPQVVYNDEYEQIYFYILMNYNIDIVQIDHSIFQTFDLASVAKSLNIPVILTLHDFYYICPTYFLLDEENKYCAGNCGKGSRNCSTRVSWFDLPVNIVEWKNNWNELVKGLFDCCDMIVTATSFTKNMFLDYYGLSDDRITLIEHGRDLIRFDSVHRVPNNYQSIRLLIPGVIGPHKGSDFIKKLKSFDVEDRLELHYIGVVDDELASIGTYHGRYDREDFAKMVYKIKPSFIGIFSVCAETYSYTLTESISVGVPVLASNLGALKTRIESDGGGWLVDINNPEQAYQKILSLANDTDEYNRVQKNMSSIKIYSIDEMGNSYKRLYLKLFNEKI